ncbi:MAG: glycosyltransferase family 2 protein [Methanosphaera stadtmanae]|nr:glycosyltransferase family 2 protein [Methanosphaera stadtmanae]
MLLSIIIPVYNSEKTIKKALDSIFEQSFNDFEIICVDDCSTDNTLNVIDEYFHDNEKIKILSNDTQLGSALSRNKGLKLAEGKYISFLDSDDYLVDKYSLEYMIDTLESNDIDMVSANIEFRNTQTGKKSVGNDLFPVIDKKTFLSGDDYGMPWYFYKNVFRKGFLDKHNIVFPDLCRGQDTVFFSDVLSKLGNYIHLPIVYYSYKVPNANKLSVFDNYYDYLISFYDVFKLLLSSDCAFCNVLGEVIKKYLDMEKREVTIKSEDELLKIIGILKKIEYFLKDKISMKHYLKIRDMHIDLITKLKTDFYKIKVSVIVPVYNVEEYLPVCLTSLIKQSLHDIEIICVDDGSTDNSGALLDFYSKKDDRIKVIKNQSNMSVGAARNKAMQYIKGKYTFFVDSDDWIDLDCLKTLYEKSEELNLDMLFIKLINYDDNENKFYKTDYYDQTKLKGFENKIFDYKQINNKALLELTISPYSKLYSTKFLKKIDVQFPENLIHEDNIFYFEVIFNAERISFCNNYFYNRRRRNNSITTTYDDSMIDAISIEEITLNYFRENNLYEDYKKPLLNQICNFLKEKFELIDTKYKPEFYNKTKILFEKINNNYNLSNDMNSLLKEENLIFYKSVINSENYDLFISKANSVLGNKK